MVFKHFAHGNYSLFAALGKVVVIGVLQVPVLTHAKADGIATDPLPADTVASRSMELDEVQVMGSRAPLSASQSPRIVSVITRDAIHRAEAQTINDILKLSTGVDVRQRGGFGVQTDISINGGTFDQITILLNGVNISNPQTGHNASDFPVSIDDIERIEVLEGASARVYGTSAFSGAINIVTRRDREPSLVARLEGGSFGTVGGDVRLGGGGRLWRSAASVGATRSDGGTTNSDFRKRHYFYSGSLSARGLDLHLQMGVARQRYGANTFYSARFDDQWEKTTHALASLGAAVRPWTAPDAGRFLASLEIAPNVYYNRFDDHYQLTRGLEGAANGENYHRTRAYGGGLNLHFDWLLGRTALGGDVRRETIWSTAYGDEQPQCDWKDISGTDRKLSRYGRRTNTSLFLEHDLMLGALTVSAGLLANRNTGLDHDFRFYPGVDVSWRPGSHWKLYASWNKALRMPTWTDLYTSNSVQQGDLHLKPERNSAFKVGARWRATGMEAVVSGFYSRGTNMIDWVYETEAASKYQALNIGKLDNMGYNVDFTLRPADLAGGTGVARGLLACVTSLKVGYAYIRQKHETEHAIYRSLYALEYLRHKLVVQLDHRLCGHLSAQWALRWQQRMNGYHPYAKLDAKLMWSVRRYEIYLKADNITCHRYYDLGSVRQPGLWMMAGAAWKL